MHSQFIKKFVNVIYRFYNNNVIIIRKKRRVKKLLKIFVKHTFVLSFIELFEESYKLLSLLLFIFIICTRIIFLFD